MPQGISEAICEASLADGERVIAYRALRQLQCATCGALIAEGAIFIRRRLHGQNLPILPQCRECAPFSLREERESPASPLLEALLATEERQPAPKHEADERIAREVERRLGPALKSKRRRED